MAPILTPYTEFHCSDIREEHLVHLNGEISSGFISIGYWLFSSLLVFPFDHGDLIALDCIGARKLCHNVGVEIHSRTEHLDSRLQRREAGSPSATTWRLSLSASRSESTLTKACGTGGMVAI